MSCWTTSVVVAFLVVVLQWHASLYAVHAPWKQTALRKQGLAEWKRQKKLERTDRTTTYCTENEWKQGFIQSMTGTSPSIGDIPSPFYVLGSNRSIFSKLLRKNVHCLLLNENKSDPKECWQQVDVPKGLTFTCSKSNMTVTTLWKHMGIILLIFLLTNLIFSAKREIEP